MLNELLRDPEIQEQYQFLLYMYPTGVPIPIAAASLRESLIQAKQMYNPDGRDPAFDQMVLLGPQHGRPAQPHDGSLERGQTLAALLRPHV